MDLLLNEAWLKNTVQGMIVLGVVIGILTIFIWHFIKKISNYLLIFFRFILDKTIIFGVKNILFKYLKFYFTFKGTLHQLKNRNKTLSIIILHKKYISNRDISLVLCIIFLLVSYFLILLSTVEYLKTSVTSIALSIIFFHDTLLNSIVVYKIEQIFLEKEEKFAKNTYSDENTLTLEAILFSDKNPKK